MLELGRRTTLENKRVGGSRRIALDTMPADKGSAFGGGSRGAKPPGGFQGRAMIFLRLRRGLEPRPVPAQVIAGRSSLIAMIDPFGRSITYLRVSVTDRCDLRCVYCMAEDMHFLPKAQVLTLEELERLCAAFIRLGTTKIRITGGEPLVRRGVMSLFQGLGSRIGNGLQELTVTTNGTQLKKYADQLVDAGVRRINVSLDTLDPAGFTVMTRWGRIEPVLEGIFAA